ncbi:serine hydrolase [Alkalihalobacillus sp. LMS39]|uniref:serine hydrolase n=1 Tax=Alkalihalobacillus sp. LMS39 TaxID=2924032 RepID=UPI001FB31DA3|nr:serine hydrolase [Alkalihalobacillus sp. LMS39]UOE93488.1 class A beta-lactamase-related serine hydrolase [Alkalihalobacillus sp. LMS39]
MVKYGVIIAISLVLIIIVFVSISTIMKNQMDIVTFLQEEEEKSSFVFIENGETKVAVRPNEYMPLASTVKIVVALEYAFQVEEGKINKEEKVELNELERYYVERLDGGAHEAWLAYIEEQEIVNDGMVTIRDIVRGMIGFSSNANTEYMMAKVGVENIEARLDGLGVQSHSPLFYYVSAMFIPYELKKDKTVKQAKEDIVKEINKMSDEDIARISKVIHQKITEDDTYIQNADILSWWDKEFDQLYSKIFTKSTTYEYANMMNQINHHQFPPIVQEEVEYALGMIMDNPENQKWLQRAGKKGGSTQFILTDALFAEDKEGNRYELAIFFHNLTPKETERLMKQLNEFELRLLTEPTYREKVYSDLQNH